MRDTSTEGIVMKDKFRNIKADWKYYAVAAVITAQVVAGVALVVTCMTSDSK